MGDFDDDENRKARERQLVLLGALLASKEYRAEWRGIRGYSERVNAALNDVIDASLVTKGKQSLKAVLEDIGVSEWDTTKGNPLTLIAEHVRLDGSIAGTWHPLSKAVQRIFRVRHGTADDKRAALKDVEAWLGEKE